jgi:hypothetical protein
VPVAVQPRPVVVLACAGSDAAHITPVVRALVAGGAKVELVTGVDARVRPLEEAVEQHGDRALYVLCHSEALDRYQGDLLELTVRAGEVAPARLLSAWFDANDGDAFTATVMQRLEQIQSGALADAPAPAKREPRSSVLRRLGASASLSVPANTLIAARAAFASRRALRAFLLAVALTALVTTALYFAL